MDAHHREAAAAIEGMVEVYGGHRKPPLVWFSESLTGPPNNRGHIVEEVGDRLAIRDEDGRLHTITRAHLAPF